MTGAARHAQHPADEPSKPSRPSIAFPEVSQRSAARSHRAARVRRRVCRSELRMRAIINDTRSEKPEPSEAAKTATEIICVPTGHPGPWRLSLSLPSRAGWEQGPARFCERAGPRVGGRYQLWLSDPISGHESPAKPPGRSSLQHSWNGRGSAQAKGAESSLRGLQKQQGPPRCPKPQLAWCLLR